VPTWVCLLRAVNLGSHNQGNMPALRAALTDAGYRVVDITWARRPRGAHT
jgi:uncharacterized protein (DUF1697 family)